MFAESTSSKIRVILYQADHTKNSISSINIANYNSYITGLTSLPEFI